MGVIPGLGIFPGGGNGSPLQDSSLENSMDLGAWRATVHGVQRVRHDWASEHKRFTVIKVNYFTMHTLRSIAVG